MIDLKTSEILACSKGKLIVEDVKSAATRTRVYLDKRKLMREKYGIDVVEVQEW